MMAIQQENRLFRSLQGQELKGITIRLPVDLLQAIREEEFYQNKSMNLLIHEMLQYHFIEEEEEPVKK